MCQASGIVSRRQLLRVAREPNAEAMLACVQRLAQGLEDPAPKRPKGRGERPRPFVFRYAPRGGPFRLQLTFRRSEVEEAEVVEALRTLLRQLEEQRADVGAPTSDGSDSESKS